MTSAASTSRLRAGILILALALIGGMGCAVIEAAGNARYESAQRALLQERQRRVAELTPAAQAGDPQAMVVLAHAILSTQQGQDVPRALAWLSRAAEQDNGAAQAVLGDFLASGRTSFGSSSFLPAAMRDRERGLALLRKAASQACRFKLPGNAIQRTLYIDPAMKLGNYLREDRQAEESRVWRARSVMHCGVPGTEGLSSYLTKVHLAPEVQVEEFALLLLSGNAKAIAEARSSLALERIVAAEGEADELRRRIAESERRYPAPKNRDLK